jgi:hypothetical protein
MSEVKDSPHGEEMRERLFRAAPLAVEVLTSLMTDTQQKGELRLKAAESILDRVCGKSALAEKETGGGTAVLSFEGVLDEWSR